MKPSIPLCLLLLSLLCIQGQGQDRDRTRTRIVPKPSPTFPLKTLHHGHLYDVGLGWVDRDGQVWRPGPWPKTKPLPAAGYGGAFLAVKIPPRTKAGTGIDYTHYEHVTQRTSWTMEDADVDTEVWMVLRVGIPGCGDGREVTGVGRVRVTVRSKAGGEGKTEWEEGWETDGGKVVYDGVPEEVVRCR